MDMNVSMGAYLSNISKWKRNAMPYSKASVKVPLEVGVGGFMNTDFLYVDVYKKLNPNFTAWQISLFNTGSGVIGGTLTENNNPISDCILYLYQSSTGVLAKRTISDADGNFKFTGLATDITYFVVGVHKTKKFNSVILDEVRIDSAL